MWANLWHWCIQTARNLVTYIVQSTGSRCISFWSAENHFYEVPNRWPSVLVGAFALTMYNNVAKYQTAASSIFQIQIDTGNKRSIQSGAPPAGKKLFQQRYYRTQGTRKPLAPGPTLNIYKRNGCHGSFPLGEPNRTSHRFSLMGLDQGSKFKRQGPASPTNRVIFWKHWPQSRKDKKPLVSIKIIPETIAQSAEPPWNRDGPTGAVWNSPKRIIVQGARCIQRYSIGIY